jgi:uncharacterized protein (UPF0332 family)
MLPGEFIDTAKALLAPDNSEADRRSCVSRAYYGAFHHCSASLPREFAPDTETLYEGGSHKAVINAMAAWGSSLKGGRSSAQQAARRIARLKRARVIADYWIQNPYPVNVSHHISDAEKIIEHISEARCRYDAAEASAGK